MNNKPLLTKKKIITSVILITLASVLFTAAALVSYAYFVKRARLFNEDGSREAVQMGMELNTFFDSIANVESGTNLYIECTNTSLAGTNNLTTTTADGKTYYTYNPDADWGSASNPYIISRINHLQNLYVLQNCGYFETLTTAGVTEANMPYFLVCEPNGSPVVIDGTDKIFEYIGNNDYPFIGYLGGSFASGTVRVNNTYESDQSVIYNLTSKTDKDVVDVGLFGHVGYLGNENAATNGKFTGAVSTIRNLLLYDVKVKVENKDLWTAIVDGTQHMFSFGNESGDVPHENHHIGILAGHVEFTTVEYISVYYSADTVPAMDVNFTTPSGGVAPNYRSISGILGFCHEMNASCADGMVSIGGVSDKDIAVSGGGVGSGGGVETGTGRGYVTASYMYEHYFTAFATNSGTRLEGQEIWKFKREGETSFDYGILIDYNGQKYTVHGTETTVSMSGSSATVGGHTWTTYIIMNTSVEPATYTAYDGKAVETFVRMPLKIQDAVDTMGEPLCTEYIRKRTVYGTENTGMYYFHDGVFTFTLSNENDTIEDTWANDTPDTITLGPDNAALWTTREGGEVNSAAVFLKPVNSQADIGDGKKVMIAAKEGNTYHIVTLAENSAYTQGNEDNAVTTKSTELNAVSAERRTEYEEKLNSNRLTLYPEDVPNNSVEVAKTRMKNAWSDLVILDIGSVTSETFNLTTLKDRYQVDATWKIDTSSNNDIYEDDGKTKTTQTLLTNSQNLQNSYFEEDWTTPFTPTNGFTVGSQVTQAEAHAWDGFIAAETTDTGYKFLSYFYASYVYYYVDSSGNRSAVLKKTGEIRSSTQDRYNTWVHPYDSSLGFTSLGNMYGVNVYSFTGTDGKTYTGPMLFLNGGSYYSSWKQVDNRQITEPSGDAVTLINGKYVTTYTASYGYFVKEMTATGVVYKWLGTGTGTTTAPDATGKHISDVYGNGYSLSTSSESTKYALYSYGDNTGFLLTHYAVDGYFYGLVEDSGISYNLNGNASAAQTDVEQVVMPDGVPLPSLSNGSTTKQYRLYKSAQGKLAIKVLIYQLTGGTYTFSHSNDTDASLPYYLSILHRNYKYSLGTLNVVNQDHYGIVVGTLNAAGTAGYLATPGNFTYTFSIFGTQNLTPTIEHSTEARLTFKGNGLVNIAYTVDGEVRYVNYDSTSKYFNSTSDANASGAQLYLFTVEALYDTKVSNNIVPIKGNEVGTYSADRYVLYPLDTSVQGQTEPTNVTYGLISIADLYKNDNGWINSTGQQITSADLYQKFSLKEKITFGFTINVFNGSWGSNIGNTTVIAPIGTDGAEANIPKGCVAFKINESSDDGYNIRVIAAIPTSADPTMADLETDNYYFALWQTESAGAATFQTFESNQYVERFLLPKSHVYESNPDPATSDYINVKLYSGSAYSNTVSRAYLHGKQILVAYTFHVTDPGVYILGEITGAMNVVYFSVDSTASTGKDGSVSYKIGTVDFVYASGTKVITVQDNDPTADGNYNYSSYYYPSLCLLSTDNKAELKSGDTDKNSVYPNINDFAVYVRRVTDGSSSTIRWKTTGSDSDYIVFDRYAIDSDAIVTIE